MSLRPIETYDDLAIEAAAIMAEGSGNRLAATAFREINRLRALCEAKDRYIDTLERDSAALDRACAGGAQA